MKKIIYIGLTVLACSAFASNSIANELEVIITSALIDSHNEISKAIHVVDGKSIGNDATQSVGTLIGLIGISSSDFGAAVGQPVIRGLSGSQLKYLTIVRLLEIYLLGTRPRQ